MEQLEYEMGNCGQCKYLRNSCFRGVIKSGFAHCTIMVHGVRDAYKKVALFCNT